MLLHGGSGSSPLPGMSTPLMVCFEVTKGQGARCVVH